MSYTSLIIPCNENDSPFAYSTGCSDSGDSWTTSNSTSLVASCSAASGVFGYTPTFDCTSSTFSIAENLSTSDGSFLVSDLDEYLTLA